jgi:hypothetical protein
MLMQAIDSYLQLRRAGALKTSRRRMRRLPSALAN